MKKKKLINYVLGIVIILFFLNLFMRTFSVFLYDYKDELRVLAEPLEKQYFTFLQRNKRTPSILESAVLIKAVGCEKVIINESTYAQDFTCLYKGKEISIEYNLAGEAAVEIDSRKNQNSHVYMKFYNSVCLFGFYPKGGPNRYETDKKIIHKVECRTSANFTIRH